MKKTTGIAGLILLIGALATGGAWYNGNQLPKVLDKSIEQANADMAKTLPALGFAASVELLSLDRQFFSTHARYRVTFTGSSDSEEAPQPVEWVVSDRIEHGPFPLSRLKALKLIPVMATSNYSLEQTPALEKWFAATQGQSPLTGQASLGYDRSVVGNLRFTPLQVALDKETELTFNGLAVDFDSSAEAKEIEAKGLMDSLRIDTRLADSQEPLSIEFKDLALSRQIHKVSGIIYVGRSEIYVGRSEANLQSAQILIGEGAPILARDISLLDESKESDGKLSSSSIYKVGMLSYQGHDIGNMEILSNIKNFDIGAIQSLMGLYGEILNDAGQVKQASLDEEQERELPRLSDEQKARLLADYGTLLAARPGVEGKALFKTANGESSLSLSLDLDKPEHFDLPIPELLKQLIRQLDAKAVVSKAMIGDIVGLQATFAGETDPEMIAQQVAMMTEMASGMALASELAKLEGDNIVTSLHYADDKVDFNGKQMAPAEFVATVFASGAGLGMDGGATGEEGAGVEELQLEEELIKQAAPGE